MVARELNYWSLQFNFDSVDFFLVLGNNQSARNSDLAAFCDCCHHAGHAINDWMGDRTKRPFTAVSDRNEFVEQFLHDINQNC